MTNEEVLTERALLRRRIKNQRKQLKLLGRQLAYHQALAARYKAENRTIQNTWMRFAADIAGSHFLGSSAARMIRNWVV
jgi:hypothetical protein